MIYRVKNWDDHFEKSDTRKCTRMLWVPMSNKHDGKGYRTLMRMTAGVQHYAAWVLIVQVASKCEPRGTLKDADGALTAADLAIKTDAPESIFRDAFEPLCKIGWLEVIDDKGDAIPSGSVGMPSGHHPEASGQTGTSSGLQDRTGHTGQTDSFDPSDRRGDDAPPAPELFKTAPAKRKAKSPSPEKQQAQAIANEKRVRVRDWWLEAWKRKRGSKYAFTGADWHCAKMLAESMTAEELPVLWYVMILYLADIDPALAKAGHPFVWLKNRLNKYMAEAQDRMEKKQEPDHGRESEQQAHEQLAELESEAGNGS